MDEWGPARLDDLAALVAAALPGEGLGPDDLLGACWEGPGVVLGLPDATGAVAVGLGPDPAGPAPVAWLGLVAVHPDARRAGRGRALLAAAEAWAARRGAVEVEVGGGGPTALWPGVDVGGTAALALVERAGYHRSGCRLRLALPTTFRHAPPPGVAVVQALDDAEVAAARALVAERWPDQLPALARALDQGSAHLAVAGGEAVGAVAGGDAVGAVAGGEAVGVAAHSVARAGWVGPVRVAPAWRGRGVGRALLGVVARDLMVAGVERAVVADGLPVPFWAKAGAVADGAWATYRKRLS